jgi:hypothetical protein
VGGGGGEHTLANTLPQHTPRGHAAPPPHPHAPHLAATSSSEYSPSFKIVPKAAIWHLKDPLGSWVTPWYLLRLRVWGRWMSGSGAGPVGAGGGAGGAPASARGRPRPAPAPVPATGPPRPGDGVPPPRRPWWEPGFGTAGGAAGTGVGLPLPRLPLGAAATQSSPCTQQSDTKGGTDTGQRAGLGSQQ